MHIRGQFTDFFFSTALPALYQISKDEFDDIAKQLPNLFSVESSDRSIEQTSQVSGLGLLRRLGEGGEVETDQVLQGFSKTFQHEDYGLSVEYTRQIFRDDKIRLIKHAAAELGRSAAYTPEIQAAEVFNQAFNSGADYLGPDGKSLCATDHPLIKSGGTQSNALSVAADLTVTSLQAALVDWMKTRRSNGQYVQLGTPRVMVAAENHFNIHEILKGQWRSDTANHTVNALHYGKTGPVEEIISWELLTDPDAWFLVAKPGRSGLVWFWREKMRRSTFKDDRNERAGYAIRYAASWGWHDFHGVYGTPGA